MTDRNEYEELPDGYKRIVGQMTLEKALADMSYADRSKMYETIDLALRKHPPIAMKRGEREKLRALCDQLQNSMATEIDRLLGMLDDD